MEWVVTYDVRRDLDRERAAARLLQEGVRIQRSVYEIRSDDPSGVMRDLAGIIRVDHDVAQAFRQCAACASARLEIGQTPTSMRERWWIA